MKEILNNSVFENIVNKSKFVAYSFSVHSANEVENVLNDLKKHHQDATHICYAFSLLGGQEKAVDDGEPQGTAGKPILDCIKKSAFSNTLIVVVRYFGGIKLGAGGLVRAYSGSASKVLAVSGINETTECQKINFCISLSESKQISKIEKIAGIKKIDAKYSNDISIDLYFEKPNFDSVTKAVENILCRAVDIVVDKKTYFV